MSDTDELFRCKFGYDMRECNRGMAHKGERRMCMDAWKWSSLVAQFKTEDEFKKSFENVFTTASNGESVDGRNDEAIRLLKGMLAVFAIVAGALSGTVLGLGVAATMLCIAFAKSGWRGAWGNERACGASETPSQQDVESVLAEVAAEEAR